MAVDIQRLRNTAAGARSVADGHPEVLADAANIEAAADTLDSLLKALRGEVEKLRHDGEMGEAIVPIPAGVRLHTADRLQAIIDHHEQGVDRG